MEQFTSAEISSYFTSRLPSMRQTTAREWRCPCPVHGGKNDNFSVNSQSGYCHCHSTCGRGWDIFGLEMDLSGAAFPDAKKAVYAVVGRPEPRYEDREIEATYDYCDANGVLRYQVVRNFGKKFWQRRPDGSGGFIRGLGGETPIPYRLDKWVSAPSVVVVEGEKDVHTVEALGLAATCNNGGAGNFKPELAPWFAGKDVWIIADNDEPGRSHALKVAALLAGSASRVRILELPHTKEKADTTDWVRAGGDRAQLDAIAAKAETWTPEWKFGDTLDPEAEKYIRTLAQVIAESGGVENFWSLAEQEGMPTPFVKLTEYLGGGMRNGEVYVIGGNQGSGKTSLMLQFLMNAIERKSGTLLFSMEMGWRDVFQRLVGIRARVDLLQYRRWQKQESSDPEYRAATTRLSDSTSALIDLPLLVHRKSAITTEFITQEISRLKRRQPISLVAVDHMQLMSSTGKERSDYEKFTSISRTIKQAAVESNVPVLLVSQTSRSNEHDKRTELNVADLRGSGAIEEDAAGVMLIYPDADDKRHQVEAGTFSQGPVKSWLKLGKSRYGQQDTYLPLMHFKTFTRFDLLEGR